LDFTNAAAGGYSVFGTAQAQQVIGNLTRLGQIGTLYDSYYQLKTLKPESSTGVHLSWEYEPTENSFVSVQLFRNDIQNLIQVQQVGAYITGAQIFSYLNIGRAFTQGIELEAKQKAMTAEQDKLNKLKADLLKSSTRLAELEKIMADKEAAMKKLKETLSKSLKAFEGKGLTVTERDGKVYVSMENKLLFESGSWTVGSEGKKAVDLVGKVLGDNPDISVLIEGHTDNDKIVGSIGGGVENNWDLSTKRATAIVNILSANAKVKKENLTAAGRGEFAPLLTNETAEGKAKNRRIEFILTPKLDELSKLLNEM
jgi:flagellar motor protein MotB